MGAKRSIERVAAKVGIPDSTIRNHSVKFGWQDRIRKLQEKIGEAAQKDIERRALLSAREMRTFKTDILKDLRKKFKKGDLSVGDTISILHVVKTELNEPTSINKVVNPNGSTSPFDALLLRLFPPDNGSSQT